MNIFKPFTLKWWEVGLLKLAMLSLGIAIGTMWPGVFAPALPWLLVLFILPAFYLGWVWLKQ